MHAPMEPAGAAKTERREVCGAESTCASSSYSSSSWAWARGLPPLLLTSQDGVHCTLCSLNVYLGKASNSGLGRSWLVKSALLMRDSQAGVGEEGEKEKS